MEYFWFLCLVLLAILVLVGLSATLAFLFSSGITVIHDPELMNGLAVEFSSYKQLDSIFKRKKQWLSGFSLPVPLLDVNQDHSIEELMDELNSVFSSQLNKEQLAAIAPSRLPFVGKMAPEEALCMLRNILQQQAPKARKKINQAWQIACKQPDFDYTAILFWRILHQKSQGEDRASRQLRQCLTGNLNALIADKFFAEKIFGQVNNGNRKKAAHQSKQKNRYNSAPDPWFISGLAMGASFYTFDSMSEVNEPSPSMPSAPDHHSESVEAAESPDGTIETDLTETAEVASDSAIEDILAPFGFLSLITVTRVFYEQGHLYYSGKIDGKEAMINTGIKLGSRMTGVAMGTGIGAALGSVIPVVGTVFGGWLGGIVVGMFGNGVAKEWQKERYYWVEYKYKMKGGEMNEANRKYYKEIQDYLSQLQRDFALKLTSLQWESRRKPFDAFTFLESILRRDLEKAKKWKARHQRSMQSVQYRRVNDFIGYGEKLVREIQSGEPETLAKLIEQFRDMPMLKYGELSGSWRKIRKIRETEHGRILVGLVGWIYSILNLHDQVMKDAVPEINSRTHILNRQQDARSNELESLRAKKKQRKAQFSKV